MCDRDVKPKDKLQYQSLNFDPGPFWPFSQRLLMDSGILPDHIISLYTRVIHMHQKGFIF